jgi:hypothetical protein
MTSYNRTPPPFNYSTGQSRYGERDLLNQAIREKPFLSVLNEYRRDYETTHLPIQQARYGRNQQAEEGEFAQNANSHLTPIPEEREPQQESSEEFEHPLTEESKTGTPTELGDNSAKLAGVTALSGAASVLHEANRPLPTHNGTAPSTNTFETAPAPPATIDSQAAEAQSRDTLIGTLTTVGTVVATALL